jgi:hypothetical protein
MEEQRLHRQPRQNTRHLRAENTAVTDTLKCQASTGAPDIRALNDRIQKSSQFVDLLRMELSKVIVGQSGHGGPLT